MKVVSVFLVAVSLFFINGFRSHAQEAWTLQQCIDYALSHNISVKQSELNEDFSKESYQQSKAGFLPNLNGNASQNYFYGRSIDPTTNLYTNNEVRSNNFSLSSSVPIFEGFQLQNALKQSKLNYLSSQYDLEKIKNDILKKRQLMSLFLLFGTTCDRPVSRTTGRVRGWWRSGSSYRRSCRCPSSKTR